ncbi:MAG TPA: dihydrofolate reductase family protein [Myxococcales bacterium]|nr:dihydrofolate reductase family protein [Myxococcales bacterium]
MQTLPVFEVMFDAARSGLPLPGPLERAYGGHLELAAEGVFANFVESVDGVVALADAATESGGIISGGSEADRFLMGLLRACADAVLIGAGTLRAGPRDLWFPESAFPSAAPLYAAVRTALGLSPRPRLYVVSGSGRVDPAHPALVEGALIKGRLGASEIVAAVKADGPRRILCEGGPGLFAELVAAHQIDDLFLTVSPRMFGRWEGDGRKALTANRDLAGHHPMTLSSARRSGSHLFLRYRLRPGA